MSSNACSGNPNVAIEINSLSKSYRLGVNLRLYDALADLGKTLSHAIRRQLDPAGHPPDTFWALRDVSFSVDHGEIVGVIGNNGAGKSTLLKILSRITLPTKGSVRFRGRIGSLLDVGTGFHPDLSGRDNIFLNGVILGMSRREIVRQFDEIVAFSGVESFIDTPVKRYSSGMYMRLAFAVAAHLDSEILLVDEVLAVGDVNFQNKCMARMSDISRGGRTILFVSHNLSAVQAICHRAIWLDHGQVAEDGDTAKVLNAYLRNAAGTEGIPQRIWHDEKDAPGNTAFYLRRCAVVSSDGLPGDPISIDHPFVIEVEYWNGMAEADLNVGWLVHNAEGVLLFEAGNWNPSPRRNVGYYIERCLIPSDFMNNGTYSLSLEVRNAGELILQFPRIMQCELLDSENGRNGWYGEWHGAFRPRFDWTVTEKVAGISVGSHGQYECS